MAWGGVLQIAFNGLQETIGNLALGRLGASEVTLEMADVYASLSLESDKKVTAGKH